MEIWQIIFIILFPTIIVWCWENPQKVIDFFSPFGEEENEE